MKKPNESGCLSLGRKRCRVVQPCSLLLAESLPRRAKAYQIILATTSLGHVHQQLVSAYPDPSGDDISKYGWNIEDEGPDRTAARHAPATAG